MHWAVILGLLFFIVYMYNDKKDGKMYTVLTIAGSDCSGGAGIQADMKTIMAHGAYAMSVVTALTAQNTTGVSGIWETAPECVGAQLDAVFSDIPPQAVKIGMICSEDGVAVISEKLKEYGAGNLVVDPVMVSTSGNRLMQVQALQYAKKELYPLAAVLTPNIPEAEVLSAFTIKDRASMQEAARVIFHELGCAVLCKGGHLPDTSDDLLYDGEQCYWFEGKQVQTMNTHGTGCTLSSAIACNLAAGCTLPDAVGKAKEYITGALLAGLDLGRGNGPLNHGYKFRI